MFPAKMTLETLKSKYPELHAEFQTSLMSEAKETLSLEYAAKLSESNSNAAKLDRENKILKACIKAGAMDQVDALCASEASVEDVYLSLLSRAPAAPAVPESAAPAEPSAQEPGFMSKVFSKTAPPPAGANSGEAAEVSTQEQAKAYVRDKFSLTSISSIAKQARRSFPELFKV